MPPRRSTLGISNTHVDVAWPLLESHLDEGRVIHVPDHLRLEVLNALLHRGLAPDEL